MLQWEKSYPVYSHRYRFSKCDSYCIYIYFQDPEVKLKVTISGKMYYVKSKYDGEMLNFRLLIRQKECLFNVHKAAAERGVVVQLQGEESSTPVHIQTVTDDKDDLLDYVLQFLQWFFLVISMKDAIKEGDIERNNVHLKVCVPFFYSHSSLSKYMEECIDYILKTEVMLSEKLALKVRAGSFVNLTGRKGDNKAADMQKENEVLVLKDLIRGLGANKTEKAIVTISKAAPVIQSITDNVDSMLGIINKRTRHKRKSYNDDVTFLLNELNSLNIWHHQNNRQLNSFHGISRSPFSFVQSAFKQTIMRMVDRLKRGIALPDINDTDSD